MGFRHLTQYGEELTDYSWNCSFNNFGPRWAAGGTAVLTDVCPWLHASQAPESSVRLWS